MRGNGAAVNLWCGVQWTDCGDGPLNAWCGQAPGKVASHKIFILLVFAVVLLNVL
jgi:hypothetical protein